MRRPALACALALLCAGGGAGGGAQANGRFPAAQHLVVGPGRASQRVLLRATFGLLVSDDGGERFSFYCEDAWDFRDGYDPPVAIGSQNAMLVGLFNGLTRSRDGCRPGRDETLDGQQVIDLAADPTGRVVIAGLVEGRPPVSRIARSDDGGERFTLVGQSFDNVTLSTVEVGSPDGMRLYATGLEGDAKSPAMWRSDDGGRSWARTRARFDDFIEVFVSGVDPTRPAVLYARGEILADGGEALGGTALLRSEDGGDTFREVTRTRDPMKGFALRGDGRAVWIGSPREGLLRSDDGGPFRVVNDTAISCLRWHSDSLWACGTFAPGAVLLWRARGDGALSPALRWNQIEPPPTRCPAGTPTRDICPRAWQVVRGTLEPRTADAGIDGGTVAPPPPSAGDGCGCATVGHSRAQWSPLAVALAALVRSVRRARNRLRAAKEPM